MKLLQINAVYGYGSTGVIVKTIHELALSKGIQSYVAYSKTCTPEKDIINGYKIGNYFGNKLHALLYRIGGKQAYFSRFSTLKLLIHIKKIKPDIVSLHNLHSNYINLNMLLKFLAKNDIKTVLTMHDCWFYTGGCFHYSQIGCNKWQKECGNCPKKNADLKARFFETSDKTLRDRKKYLSAIKNLTCIGVSEWISGELKKSILNDKHIVTIENGIDTSFFTPTESDFRAKYNLEGKFLILGLASKYFNPVNKETFDFVVNSMNKDDLLVLIGCTSEQQESLPENVLGLPFIYDRDEMRKIFSACDVFANCSREDTLSSINLEAQACGTPVVVYNTTGLPESICDGETGYVVECGNANCFVDKIFNVKRQTKKCYHDRCVDFVAKKYNAEINFLKVLKLFEDIMNNEE